MFRHRRSRPGLRWVLPALVLFLALGHPCEWPAHAGDAAAHAAEHAASAQPEPPGDAQISCVGPDALSSSAGSHPVAGLPALAPLPPMRIVLARPTAAPRDEADRLADRPPRYLLHAALLI